MPSVPSETRTHDLRIKRITVKNDGPRAPLRRGVSWRRSASADVARTAPESHGAAQWMPSATRARTAA
jgi:hypothetical protein